jgi:UDP-N-acetylmuramate--alanine ligase
MLAQALVATGADPTVHIGGTLDYIGGNTRIGRGDVFLTEACEFNASFLHLRPTVAVITNIDEDHLDFYKDIDDIQSAFGRFLALLPPEGCAVGNGDDERVVALLDALSCRTVTFGQGERCDWRPLNLRYDGEGRAEFDAALHGKAMGHVSLRVAGFFHMYNALAAVACAHAQGADPAAVCAALCAFTGAHRRFELTGVIDGVKLYHDYGHNPAEMKNVLSVARLQPHNRLWAVMQPHTFSRVKRLFNDYLTCTRDADITLVTDIYAAREKDPATSKPRRSWKACGQTA